MLTTILYQILLIIGIIVGVMAIINLWHASSILKKIEEMTDVIDTRLREINTQISEVQSFLSRITSAARTFMLSFDAAKSIKNKLEDILEDKKEKGEDDGKE
jgi:CHASE3 domain sensor protein